MEGLILGACLFRLIQKVKGIGIVIFLNVQSGNRQGKMRIFRIGRLSHLCRLHIFLVAVFLFLIGFLIGIHHLFVDGFFLLNAQSLFIIFSCLLVQASLLKVRGFRHFLLIPFYLSLLVGNLTIPTHTGNQYQGKGNPHLCLCHKLLLSISEKAWLQSQNRSR